ncbi:MAG: hypothetical protein H6Q16_372 [Bacteroidetes bacterium]|nr:hypothetical protein [Bacteroidota bacterium]
MNKFLYILILIAALFVGGCSTIEDDLDDCIQMRVYIDFDDPDDVEWGNYYGIKTLDNSPKDVKLYISDKNNNLLGVHYLKTQKVYELPYKQYDSVYYIAVVSNYISDDIFPNFHIGEKITSPEKANIPFISLKDDFSYYDINNISRSPHDFQMKFGFIPTIRKDNEMAPHYIYVERKVGAIRCIIIGLNAFLNKENAEIAQKDSPYAIIFGETPKDIGFDGRFIENWTNYKLPIISEINDTITTQFVNTFPTLSERASEIKIFKHNYQVVKKNGAKNNAVVRAGKPTTVIINFNETTPPGEGGMGVSTDKWDSVIVNANF